MTHPSRCSGRVATTVLATALVVLPLLAWGCGSSGGNAATATRAAAGGCVSDVYRCVRVTFTNDLSFSLLVMGNGRGQGKQELDLTPGASGALTGYTTTIGAYDLTGRIRPTDQPDLGLAFFARNPQVGYPCMGLARAISKKTCVQLAQPGSGARRTVRVMADWAEVTYTREANSTDFVEFRARIRPA